MKKTVLRLFAAALLLSFLAVSSAAEVEVEDESYYEAFRGKKITLNVYNWGEYISDGTDDSLDVIKEFEEISGINVNYTMFDTNEDMYAKLVHGGSQYDIIIPSDYMIARLINEGLVEKINFDNIPNISFIDDRYRYTDFDPNGEYSVPYTWSMVGLVYNTKYVTPEQAESWSVLWDETLSGKVLMFGNSRDAFGIAQKMLGYSMNSEDPEEIEKAADLLVEQKKVNQAYAMDQTFDKMANENAYAAPYYAGDCLTMMERNEDLAFSYPKEGVNLFIDAICIPKGSKNKEAAEAFINFLCETEIATANCEYIYYFTPHTVAAELVEFDECIIPDDETIANAETFSMLGDDANSLMEYGWIRIRASSDFDSPLYTLTAILLLAVIIFVILYVVRRRTNRRSNY